MWSSTFGYIWVTLKVLVGLGLVIFVHELGHFLVAKACGVKCEKFYLGFDVPIRLGPLRLPRTLGKFQWGETEYGIGIIPLGGYVKMLGQDDNPANAQQEAERIRVQKASVPAEPVNHELVDHEPVEPSSDAGEVEYELDPRSFPAKSVPQRMAIISAGVIMNLIFAVIFGAIAYRMGVKVLSRAKLGARHPARQPGSTIFPSARQIVQLGKMGIESDYLRFDWDLRQFVAHAGMGEEPQAIDVKLKTVDGQQEWASLVPDTRLVRLGEDNFATIGIRSTGSTTLSSQLPVVPSMSAAEASPPFAPGDQIVGVDGQRFRTDRANELGEIPSYELEAALAAHLDEPMTFQVQRTEESAAGQSSQQTLDITVPPNPLKRIGIVLQIGRILAVREMSPAAAAGFEVGDLITHVHGEEVGDPLILSQRLRKWIGQDVPVVVDRMSGGSRKSVELTVRPVPRFQLTTMMVPGSLVGIEPIGVAFAVENTVIGVEPGSSAADAGLQSGDVLKTAQFVATTDDAEKLAQEIFLRGVDDEIHFDDKKLNWPFVWYLMQNMPQDVDLKLSCTRGGDEMSATLKARKSDQWYFADRGIQLRSLQRVHTAASWSEAWGLGYRETKEQFYRVLDVLGKLVTMQLSPKNLGGPLMIAAVAGSEASQGIPRLLIFLTFLSANLAILNFLPIPALDGGHMVFLTAEAVTGKPVDERLQGTLTLIGVVCLLGLMIFVFANDIGRLFL